MRKEPLINDSYYHIYNRGVDKRDIFMNQKDTNRFLLSMKVFMFEESTQSIRLISKDNFADVRRLQKGRKLVSFVEYCLNPNHFHFILKQEIDGGISEFMKRLQGGYTKYFNEKYDRSGALFQGKFKSSHIATEDYFGILLAYVMWNYKVHDISKSKINLVKNSEREYESGMFDIISSKEGNVLLKFFDGYSNFLKHSKKMIDLIRNGRGKEGLDYQD